MSGDLRGRVYLGGGRGPSSGGRGASQQASSSRGALNSGSRSNRPRRTAASDTYGAGGGYGDSQAQSRRQPRQHVDYTPHTYAEYQAVCQPGNWEKLGKLGPDLQDDDLIEKRAQKERMKEYSRNLRMQNAQSIDYCKHMKDMDLDESYGEPTAKQPSKREKMAKYAAQVPKPKIKKKVATDAEGDGYEGYGQPTRDAPLSILEELEAKHRQDQLAVAAIRKEMGLCR